LQLYYYDSIRQKGLYRDKQCTSKVNTNETVTKASQLYLGLTSQEYELQIRKLFEPERKEEKIQGRVEEVKGSEEN
jgi:hypothetical protein